LGGLLHGLNENLERFEGERNLKIRGGLYLKEARECWLNGLLYLEMIRFESKEEEKENRLKEASVQFEGML
jgi:hypothetical protein